MEHSNYLQHFFFQYFLSDYSLASSVFIELAELQLKRLNQPLNFVFLVGLTAIHPPSVSLPVKVIKNFDEVALVLFAETMAIHW